MNEDLIKEKVFRLGDNLQKIKYIMENAGIPESIILKAAMVAEGNSYHNFGHQLGATEDAILIALQEGLSKEEIYLLALSMLFHDARHTGVARAKDEMIAAITAFHFLTDADLAPTGKSPEEARAAIRDIILSTVFANRGKSTDKLHQIAQDADLAHLGHGPYRWIWASMGLRDEFNLSPGVNVSPRDFIRISQRKFVEFILSKNKQFWITEGAMQILGNPAEDLAFIESLSDEAVEYADSVRFENIPLSDFKERMQELIGVPQ